MKIREYLLLWNRVQCSVNQRHPDPRVGSDLLKSNAVKPPLQNEVKRRPCESYVENSSQSAFNPRCSCDVSDRVQLFTQKDKELDASCNWLCLCASCTADLNPDRSSSAAQQQSVNKKFCTMPHTSGGNAPPGVRASPYEPGVYFVGEDTWQVSLSQFSAEHLPSSCASITPEMSRLMSRFIDTGWRAL